jgi:hypothetical protein
METSITFNQNLGAAWRGTITARTGTSTTSFRALHLTYLNQENSGSVFTFPTFNHLSQKKTYAKTTR